jgi:hypothetical protein
MFDIFTETFILTEKFRFKSLLSHSKINLLTEKKDICKFLNLYEGCTFNHGLYRIHLIDNIKDWNSIVSEVFSVPIDRTFCFGYDWLGRQLAVNLDSTINGEPEILRFDVGSGLMSKIPCSFYDFHENEMVNYTDTVFDCDLFSNAKETIEIDLPFEKCFGFINPVFCQGEFSVRNMKVVSLKVYWHIFGQLLQTIDRV